MISWFTGLGMCVANAFVPALIIGIIVLIIAYYIERDIVFAVFKGLIVFSIACILIGAGTTSYMIYETMEKPTVEEHVVTIDSVQLAPNVEISEHHRTINDADELIFVCKDGTTYQNKESFWWGKFNTRDYYNTLKVNGTYKIKSYGWREGYTSSFPNIIDVEVINDTGCKPNNILGIPLYGMSGVDY